ncbi:hypothetical protein BSKO_13839 [Bryopsis sp. KO-2023]|nr:hypothetical protein BSKO_13839 [Bryopsis sp. KO-2023]
MDNETLKTWNNNISQLTKGLAALRNEVAANSERLEERARAAEQLALRAIEAAEASSHAVEELRTMQSFIGRSDSTEEGSVVTTSDDDEEGVNLDSQTSSAPENAASAKPDQRLELSTVLEHQNSQLRDCSNGQLKNTCPEGTTSMETPHIGQDLSAAPMEPSDTVIDMLQIGGEPEANIPPTRKAWESDPEMVGESETSFLRQDSFGAESMISISDALSTEPKSVGRGRSISHFFFGVVEPEERGKWDLYIVFLMFWVCIVSPYTVCFGIKTTLDTTIGILEFLVDVSFAYDIYLNFRTAYRDDDGALVFKRSKIAEHYFKGWLSIDLISILPFDHVSTYSKSSAASSLLKLSRVIKTVKILRLLKAIKLLRLLFLPRLFDMMENFLGRPLFRTFRFLLAVVVISHWSACIFYFIAYTEGEGTGTWVDNYGLATKSNSERYVSALYWAFATMTSVGYGDVVAITVAEKIMAIICMIIGVTVFAYLMGAVTSILGALNSSQSRITAKKQRIDEFLKNRKVPTALCNRIRQFYGYIVDKEVRNDETDIISGLPNKMRVEVVLFLFRDIMSKVMYFDNKAPQFIAELVMMMKIEFYAPEDFVVVQGEMSTEMYFIGEGTLAIRNYENMENLPKLLYSGGNVNVTFKHLGYIKAGSQFGEYACLTMEARTATVVAETFCELYALSRDSFLEVMNNWPEYKSELTNHMMQRSKVTKEKQRKKRRGAIETDP